MKTASSPKCHDAYSRGQSTEYFLEVSGQVVRYCSGHVGLAAVAIFDGFASVGDFNWSTLSKRTNDALHERPGVAHWVIKLANDLVHADGLKLGNASAYLFKRADQSEFEPGVGVDHLLFTQ